MNLISVVQLGTVDYTTGLRLQQQLVSLRKEERIGDVLLLLEHKPVITLGRNAKAANIIASPELLKRRGVELFETNRGGDVTFHGPGQLVGYPIFDLRGYATSSSNPQSLSSRAEANESLANRSPDSRASSEQATAGSASNGGLVSSSATNREGHDFSRAEQAAEKKTALAAGVTSRKHLGAVDFVRRLEEVLIRTCADFAIPTKRVPGLTGVWTDAQSPSPQDGLKRLSFRAEENDSKNRSQESRNLLLAGAETNPEAKLAAIGVHISRFVTSHGFALNVNPDLSYFDLIIPCGITSKPVTSMQHELSHPLNLTAVAESISRNFGVVFQSQILRIESLDALLDTCGAGALAREP